MCRLCTISLSHRNMKFQATFKSLSPWTIITITGCALLSTIDVWREQPYTAVPLIRGTLPNLLAVPILTFGFLMLKFPKRLPYEPSLMTSQRKWFWLLFVSAFFVTVVWELLQLTGSLVFDVNDLYATGMGSIVTILLYFSLRKVAFLDAV